VYTALDISLTDSALLELEASDSNTGVGRIRHVGCTYRLSVVLRFEVLE